MKYSCLLFVFISFSFQLYCQDIKPVKTLSKHTGGVSALAFSPNGSIMVTGGEDKNILIWNTQTWESSKPIAGHTNTVNAITFLASGTRFYSGGDFTVRSWNLKGQGLDWHKASTTYIWSVAIKPDSTQWVAGTFEKNLRLFDYKTGKLTNLTAHSKSSLAVALSPNGKVMASGSLDENILLWETGSYKVIDTLRGHGGNVYCLTFSPDGKYLASASKDNTVRIWETGTGKLLKTFRGHTDAVFSVAFSGDGNYLASGSVDTNVILWEICNGEQLATFSGHSLAVNEVAFHPSGNLLASASLDKTICLWEFGNELIVMHYFGDELKKEQEASGLFVPKGKDENKPAFQERQQKANNFNKQLIDKYYAKYAETIKGVWKINP